MKPPSLILRCYAKRDPDGSWFGMCLDLNLHARADSLPDVRAKLHDMMIEYVTEAVTEDQQYAEQLLQRRAPLWFWVQYYLYCLFGFVRHNSRKDVSSFSELLPLAPAV